MARDANADARTADEQNPAPQDFAHEIGDDVVVYFENRATHGVHEKPVTVNDYHTEKGTLEVAYESEQGRTVTARVEAREDDEWGRFIALGHSPSGKDDHTKGSVVRVISQARHEWEQEAAHYFCMNCQEFHDSVTPVRQDGSRMGTSACPECLDADPLRKVVHEVGDERTVKYGYIPEGSRDHGNCITLEAAEAIAQAADE